MKKQRNLILAFALLLTAFSSGYSQERIATFFAQDGERFWVVLDGIKQNDKPSANVKVTGLTNSSYRVKVIFEDEKINNVDQSIMTEGFVDESSEVKPADVTWVLRKDRKGKMVMRGSSFKAAGSTKAAEPRQETVKFHTEPLPEPAPVTTQTTTTQTTTTRQNNMPPAQQQQLNINISTDGLNTNMQVSAPNTDSEMQAIPASDVAIDVNVNGQTTSNTTIKTTTTTTTTNTRQTNTTQPPPPSPTPAPVTEKKAEGCVKAMSATDFQAAKSSISKQSFSETKMNVAKQAIKGCLNTAQVRELIPLFSFEGDKLSFAKLAYDYTVDKNNYYTLTDLFGFSSSVDDLTEFLNSK